MDLFFRSLPVASHVPSSPGREVQSDELGKFAPDQRSLFNLERPAPIQLSGVLDVPADELAAAGLQDTAGTEIDVEMRLDLGCGRRTGVRKDRAFPVCGRQRQRAGEIGRRHGARAVLRQVPLEEPDGPRRSSPALRHPRRPSRPRRDPERATGRARAPLGGDVRLPRVARPGPARSLEGVRAGDGAVPGRHGRRGVRGDVPSQRGSGAPGVRHRQDAHSALPARQRRATGGGAPRQPAGAKRLHRRHRGAGAQPAVGPAGPAAPGAGDAGRARRGPAASISSS